MIVPFIRTLILYIGIIVAVRLMGKRQVGEMQPTELVITILISAVASVPMQDVDIPIAHGLIPILTLVAAEVVISFLSMHSLAFRRLLTGKPLRVINKGEIDQKALKRLRLTLDDVMEDLRLKGIFDLRQVRHAQVETNGQLSVMLNTADSPATHKALALDAGEDEPFIMVIADGCLMRESLAELDRSREWLSSVLREHGAEHVSQVFLLCADKNGEVIYFGKES
ncbi:MAG: DUF421 domain-containing protein [Clostridia bacterium]|nr:DUF421 domain-containing protein [Clostridia bacterium]